MTGGTDGRVGRVTEDDLQTRGTEREKKDDDDWREEQIGEEEG